MTIFVLSKDGRPLMPTKRPGKVRHLLREKKAVICKRDPFTIQLTYETTNYIQDMEECLDTGYQHIGNSIKSEAREYKAEQRDLLSDEKMRHDDCYKYRHTRRDRKTRYRAKRFDNRKATKQKGWIPPSLKNKADSHVDLIRNYCNVAPIRDIYIEMGQFDTQVLQAVKEGKPVPEGIDYQHGPLYGADTLREAVFQRDNYTCIFCGRSSMDGAILHEHHAYYWKGRHGNRLDELATACEKCHTPANHKPGGKLWGYDKKMKEFHGAAYMNTIRWYIYNRLKKELPDIRIHMTYGAVTKRSRLDLGLEKSHINDAYSMGRFHPAERAGEEFYQKRRRNNRILEKFYDAKYIDIRDGKKKSGKDLGCERTNRREPRNSEKNLRIFHGKKVSKGRRSIRTRRYAMQPGDVVLYNRKKYAVKGCQHYGEYVNLGNGLSVKVTKVIPVCHSGSWKVK